MPQRDVVAVKLRWTFRPWHQLLLWRGFDNWAWSNFHPCGRQKELKDLVVVPVRSNGLTAVTFRF
jgi:hypothetical protein